MFLSYSNEYFQLSNNHFNGIQQSLVITIINIIGIVNECKFLIFLLVFSDNCSILKL